MLEVRNLSVSYGRVRAVAGIDLSVPAGHAVALLGPNGAGKTSTLRAISGLEPSGGTVRFDGTDLQDVPPETVARAGLIHVPEGRHVFPNLTVHENLVVGATARANRSRAFSLDDIYDLFPLLVPLRDRAGWALSGGEQQMVAVGRALLGSPRLILLDEPSLGLAPIVAEEVLCALLRATRNTAMLVVEQSTSMAFSLCSRVHVMSGGEIVLEDSPEGLSSREDLMASYLGGHTGAPSDHDRGAAP